MTPDSLEVYSSGLVACSVCAPVEMTKEEVEAEVNKRQPTGIQSPWAISKDPTFRDGVPNGGIQNCSRGKTRHWLLSC